MKKKIIVLGIIILLAVVGLSGCNEKNEQGQTYTPSWEIVRSDYTTSPIQIPDAGGYYADNGISSAYIDLKNTGNKRETFIVDFQFLSEEWGKGIYIWGNANVGDKIYSGNVNSQFDQDQISIESGDTRRVSGSCNPLADTGQEPSDYRIVRKWRYEVNVED